MKIKVGVAYKTDSNNDLLAVRKTAGIVWCLTNDIYIGWVEAPYYAKDGRWAGRGLARNGHITGEIINQKDAVAHIMRSYEIFRAATPQAHDYGWGNLCLSRAK